MHYDCPIGSGIGMFHTIRINPDNAPNWLHTHAGLKRMFQDEQGLPARSERINYGSRLKLLNNKWWINDADCLLVFTIMNIIS